MNHVISELGNKFWYKDGKLHREDGPAVENVFGDKYWWIEGKRHRLDGPAVEWRNGHMEWFYEGKRIECNSQEEFERLIRLKAFW